MSAVDDAITKFKQQEIHTENIVRILPDKQKEEFITSSTEEFSTLYAEKIAKHQAEIAKLKALSSEYVVKLSHYGFTQREIAQITGQNQPTISMILKNKTE